MHAIKSCRLWEKISLKFVLKLEECLEDQGYPIPTGKEQDQSKD